MIQELLEEAVSTNDRAKELAHAGAPHGSWVSARRQTGGRGRLGRRWVSLEGNLFFSMVVRISERSRWSWIPLAAGVAAARAVEQVSQTEVQLKWPNDLRVGDAKLGGILCEGSIEAGFVVVGLGLNCVSVPEELDQPATSLSALGAPVTADMLRPVLVNELCAIYEELIRSGPSAVASEYKRRSVFVPGLSVEWSAGKGRVTGLGEHGELLVQLDSGKVVGIFADDVSEAGKIREAPKASGESPA